MSKYLEKLKSRSGITGLNQLRRAIDVPFGKHLERKVDTALRSIGESKLADKLRSCGRGAVCSSLYCRDCRNSAAIKMQRRLESRFRSAIESSEERLQERWRYLTVLCEVAAFDNRSVKAAVTRARKVLRALKRKYKDLWVQGAFEFELVDLNDRRDEEFSVKRKTLEAMLDNDKARCVGKKILVHYHAVVDVGEYNADAIGDWFKNRYGKHPRQIQFKKTRSGQNVSEKIRKLASYGFKNRLRYNKSFITSGYETGDHFSNEDAGKLIKLYHQFISSGSGSYKSVLIGL